MHNLKTSVLLVVFYYSLGANCDCIFANLREPPFVNKYPTVKDYGLGTRCIKGTTVQIDLPRGKFNLDGNCGTIFTAEYDPIRVGILIFTSLRAKTGIDDKIYFGVHNGHLKIEEYTLQTADFFEAIRCVSLTVDPTNKFHVY